MSKRVKIPECMKPNFICYINGRKYSYPAGIETEVPDEVATVIENHMLHRADLMQSQQPRVFLEEISGQSMDLSAIGFSGMTAMYLTQPITFREGTTYHVTFNGQVYPCKAYWSELMSCALIGNKAFGNALAGNTLYPDTGEPFVIFYMENYGATFIGTTAPMDVTISILEEVATIPDESVDTMFRIRLWGGGSGGPLQIDRTWSEICDALAAGKMVYVTRAYTPIANGKVCLGREDYRFTYGHWDQDSGYMDFVGQGSGMGLNIQCTDGVMTIK